MPARSGAPRASSRWASATTSSPPASKPTAASPPSASRRHAGRHERHDTNEEPAAPGRGGRLRSRPRVSSDAPGPRHWHRPRFVACGCIDSTARDGNVSRAVRDELEPSGPGARSATLRITNHRHTEACVPRPPRLFDSPSARCGFAVLLRTSAMRQRWAGGALSQIFRGIPGSPARFPLFGSRRQGKPRERASGSGLESESMRDSPDPQKQEFPCPLPQYGGNVAWSADGFGCLGQLRLPHSAGLSRIGDVWIR